MIIRPAGVIWHQGRLLLMRYRYGEHVRFNLPGGNQEPGESADRCLERELGEELGIAAQVGDLLLVAETDTQERQVCHLIFSIPHFTGTPALSPGASKAEALHWFSLDELAHLSLYPAVGSYLPVALNPAVTAPRYLGRIHQEWF